MLKLFIVTVVLLLSATAQGLPSRRLQQLREVVVNEDNIDQLAELIREAESGTSFVFASDLTLSSRVGITNDNITFSGDPDNRPVLSCTPENTRGAFRVSSDGVTFENLVIRDCRSTAIDVFPGVPQFNFSDPDATIEVPESLGITVRNVDFLNNLGSPRQDKAGGIHLATRVRLVMDRCRFENNTAMNGGAMSFRGQSLTMTSTTFVDNSAERSAGAIFGLLDSTNATLIAESRFSITSCMFVRNNVQRGTEDPQGLTTAQGSPLESNRYINFPYPSRSGGALLISNFADVIIDNCTFEENFAVPAGGAMYVMDNGNIEITRSIFVDNYVLPTDNPGQRDLQLGGALFIAYTGTSRTSINTCTFQNNTAIYGGALHYVGPSVTEFTITNCDFRENEATLGGGAIILRQVSAPMIERSRFIGNRAFVGGAIFVTNGAGLQLRQAGTDDRATRFQDNVANDGGALFVLGGGIVQSFRVLFRNNRAVHNGGGICFVDSRAGGSLAIQDARMFNNSAENGGALYLENLSTFTLIPSTIDRARATFAEAEQPVNTFQDNKAVAGGAIYYRASNLVSNSFRATTASFEGNRAFGDLSEVYDVLPSIPMLTRRLLQVQSPTPQLLDLSSADPCHPGGGGAICLALSGLTNNAPIMVQIFESNFTRNRALSGGAMLISTDTGDDWQSSCGLDVTNAATFLTNDPCRELALRDLRFRRNRAHFAGGAVLASSFDHVFYSNATDSDSSPSNYMTIDAAEDSPMFDRNRVDDGGYGPNLAGTAVALNISSPGVDPSNGLLVANQSSGQSHPLPSITVTVLDGLNQIVSAGILDATLRVRANARRNDASIAAGQVVATAANGSATFEALTLSAPDGRYEVAFSVRGERVQSASGNVTIRECGLGEYYSPDGFVCVNCTFESFTIYTQVERCEDCPDNARCAGNASWVPNDDYWHSSPFSVIMHECFHSDACSYRNRTKTLERQREDNLESFLSRFDDNEHPVFTNEEYTQCAKGYEGPLCGSCKDGYGHADGKTCIKCGSRSSTASVIFLLAVWQLMLLAVTIRSALVSIRDMNQMMAVAQQQAALASIPSRRAPSTPTASSSFAMDADSMMSRRTAGMPGDVAPSEIESQYNVTRAHQPMATVMPQPATQPTPKQQYSAQYIVAAQHVSETIKIFVNFFQVTSVAVNINLEWSTSIKNMLAGMNSVAGFSNGATFTPMTCMLDSNSDVRSIHGLILRIAFPLCLMVLVMGVFFIRWYFMRRSPQVTRFISNQFIRSRSIICFLVVGFFAYQSISEDLMGTVSCIKLDKGENSDAASYDNAEIGVNYSQFSIAQKRYWTEDTNIECFSRHHAYLVGFLGIPGIILFLCGIPLYLLFFLLYKRHRNELMHINVLNTYGFIYQNYQDKFVFWEVMILIRKALIGAIVVFAYPLGANLQGIMALGVLILGLAIHLIATPFKYLPLNILEGCSLVVSIFTFYAGVVFNDENTSENAEVLMSVLLVIVNSLLGFVFIFTVFVYGDKYVVAKLKYLDAQTIPGNPISRMMMLASKLSEQFRRTVTLHISRTVKGRNRAARRQTMPPIQMSSMPAGSGSDPRGTTMPPSHHLPTGSDTDIPLPNDPESQL